jgi:hypothetical protein
MPALTEHWKGQEFYGYKQFVFGRRFYFPAPTKGDKQARANAQAFFNALELEGKRLKFSGATEWNPGAIQRAKVLAGLSADMPEPLPLPSAPASVAATAVAETITPVAAPAPVPVVTVRAAIARFKAEQLQRYEAKDIGYETYCTICERLEMVEKAVGYDAKPLLPDVPVAQLNRDILTAIVSFFKKRPIAAKTKQPISVQTVKNTCRTLRQFCGWLYSPAELWDGFRGWEDCFKLDTDKLLTGKEQDEKAKGIPTFTIPELCTLYANATTRTRAYILLALNTGATQKELATMRASVVHLDASPAHIARNRNKTGVYARWELWAETVKAYRPYFIAATDTEGWKAQEGGGNISGLPEGWSFPAESEGLALLTDEGYPLVHHNGSTSATGRKTKTDSVRLGWDRLYVKLRNAEKRAAKNGETVTAIRKLGFKYLRKTGSQLVRNVAGLEVAVAFLSQGTPDKKHIVAEKHYNNRDFDTLAEALRTVREQLSPMFEAAREADKRKAQKGQKRQAA